MDDITPFYRKPRFWQRFIPLGLFLVFLWVFWDDVRLAVRGGWTLFLIFVTYGFDLLNTAQRQQIFALGVFDNAVLSAMVKVVLNLFIYFGVYSISLFVVAQFVLPVHTWQERLMAWKRLRSYPVGWHGPAVFVREGKLVSQVGEEDSVNPGVALVDLRSAIILEQTNPWALESETEGASAYAPPNRRPPLFFSRRSLPEGEQYSLTRVCGPGINFTEWGEKIRDVVDLRPQMRMEPGVKAFTKDGIEVETKVFAGFSLSGPPDVIPVAYVGGNSVENLFGLVIEEKEPGVVAIKDKFNLDPQDAWEIHRLVTSGGGEAGANGKTVARPARSIRKGPFTFDEQRVFAAAYGQAYRSSSSEKTKWHELPLLVAVETFRNHLEKYNYDYLYMFDDPKMLPWFDEIKPEFVRKVKYQGLLSFKLMRFAGAGPASTKSLAGWNTVPLDENHFGESIRESSLECSAPCAFQNTFSKPLRERGITILFAGFSELKPPPAIRTKMAERWKAKLDLEIETIRARNDREAMQLINSARTQSQRDATYFLSNLLKKETHSKEALALLIFQALQAAATDEKNHKDLPPREILGMMQNLHRWLLVEWEESDAKRKANKENKPPGDQPRSL